ncbi:hypothetical protein B0T16DRAFT_431564 [Cercophora newfieldiana]|uniref:Tyrosinase copper-binding domain-containing protein n=1 Tax=Cercophora newfieldiana TaxID=92897 RepID=A0AA40CKQ1_9PEZI|nr:hypothetical protein B0T16DRAFT_431564 [Cercophora newfieldiana]
MAPLTRFLLSLLAAGSSLAVPVAQEVELAGRPGGGGDRLRKSWHSLTNAQKKAYIDAELCLMSKPSTSGLRGARTRFDDFQSVHVSLTEIVHYAGQFLPWHRLFVWAHEQALEKECGYKGGQPYWDEPLDAGFFSTSVVLDPVTGFGGNGVGASRCIADGPFANYTNALGPSYAVNDHCIERTIMDFVSWATHAQYRDRCLAKTSWLDFWTCVEASPHNGGHGGVGSQMSNPISSPGDPLFFLHHAWLDQIWAHKGNLTLEFPGDLFPSGIPPPPGFPGSAPGGGGPPAPDLTRPADVPEPVIIGDPANVTTLKHVLQMLGLTADRTIAEVMDTRGFMCYRYDV